MVRYASHGTGITGGSGASSVTLAPEITLNTAVAGANDTALGTTNRFYTFFTMPTTYPIYLITGIEWLNGTVINGSMQGFLEEVDANLPTINNTNLLAFTAQVAHAGASAVQRMSRISSHIVRSGIIVGASIVSNSATGRCGTTTVGAGNRLRAITQANPGNTSTIAWSSGTEEPYIKVYARGIV